MPHISSVDERRSRFGSLGLDGLKELLRVLETALAVDGIAARRRNQAKERLPRLDRQDHHFASILQASQMVGKTIERAEYGKVKTTEGLHGNEGLLVYFTDGSILE